MYGLLGLLLVSSICKEDGREKLAMFRRKKVIV
jgi:hypothetical protein